MNASKFSYELKARATKHNWPYKSIFRDIGYAKRSPPMMDASKELNKC